MIFDNFLYVYQRVPISQGGLAPCDLRAICHRHRTRLQEIEPRDTALALDKNMLVSGTEIGNLTNESGGWFQAFLVLFLCYPFLYFLIGALEHGFYDFPFS